MTVYPCLWNLDSRKYPGLWKQLTPAEMEIVKKQFIENIYANSLLTRKETRDFLLKRELYNANLTFLFRNWTLICIGWWRKSQYSQWSITNVVCIASESLPVVNKKRLTSVRHQSIAWRAWSPGWSIVIREKKCTKFSSIWSYIKIRKCNTEI